MLATMCMQAERRKGEGEGEKGRERGGKGKGEERKTGKFKTIPELEILPSYQR